MVDFAPDSHTLSPDDTARQVWHAPAELLESLPVALYLCGRDGRLLRYNRRCAELWVVAGTVQKIAQGLVPHPRRIRG